LYNREKKTKDEEEEKRKKGVFFGELSHKKKK